MDNELWVPIEESEHCYISNKGRLYREEHVTTAVRGGTPFPLTVPGKYIGTNNLSTKGYPRVNLRDRIYLVHRLVAKYFIPNYENKSQVNHKDGNKLNNEVINLEWVTNQENRDHAVLTGLHKGPKCLFSEQQTMDMWELYRAGYTQRELAVIYSTKQQTISKSIARARRLFYRDLNRQA